MLYRETIAVYSEINKREKNTHTHTHTHKRARARACGLSQK